MGYETVRQIHNAVIDELGRSLADEWAAKRRHDKRKEEAQDSYNRALLRRIFGDHRPTGEAPDQGADSDAGR